MSNYPHYHVQYDEPTEVWPKGGWSVYHIDGDEIAERVVREKIVKPERGPAYYDGKVIARHSWCGFLGMVDSTEKLVALIDDHKEYITVFAKRIAAGKNSFCSYGPKWREEAERFWKNR